MALPLDVFFSPQGTAYGDLCQTHWCWSMEVSCISGQHKLILTLILLLIIMVPPAKGYRPVGSCEITNQMLILMRVMSNKKTNCKCWIEAVVSWHTHTHTHALTYYSNDLFDRHYESMSMTLWLYDYDSDSGYDFVWPMSLWVWVYQTPVLYLCIIYWNTVDLKKKRTGDDLAHSPLQW